PSVGGGFFVRYCAEKQSGSFVETANGLCSEVLLLYCQTIKLVVTPREALLADPYSTMGMVLVLHWVAASGGFSFYRYFVWQEGSAP
ncbi:MAG: hypothetical protein ACLTYY_01595, partial [Faecalibacterium prausnitzii]